MPVSAIGDDSESQEAESEYQTQIASQRQEDSARRRFLYDDVESLLADGFLTASVEINGVVLTFRTIGNQYDTQLRARCKSATIKGDVLRWIIASSIWMIDGLDLSGDTNSPYHLMAEYLRAVRTELLNVLTCIVNGLRARVDRAVTLTEPFCYEPYSRATWRLQGRVSDSRGACDNVVRKIWVAHNLAEDDYQTDVRQWEHTKVYVGSMSSKGAQHLARELDRLRAREDDRRHRIITDAINGLLHGPGWDKKTRVKLTVGGQEYDVDHVTAATTFDDLEEQMRRVVTGNKDAHDVVVDEYMRQIQVRTQERQEAYAAAIAEARSKVAPGVTGTSHMVGYTIEQLAELGIAAPSSTKSDGSSSAISNHLFDKIIASDIQAGWISISQVPEPYGKDSGGTTLQDKVANRKPGPENLR